MNGLNQSFFYAVASEDLHIPAYQTLSNAFFKPMKLWNRSRWCCMCFSMMTRLLKICSIVLRSGLKNGLLFCQQFVSFGLESIEDNSEQDLAGMAD